MLVILSKYTIFKFNYKYYIYILYNNNINTY